MPNTTINYFGLRVALHFCQVKIFIIAFSNMTLLHVKPCLAELKCYAFPCIDRGEIYMTMLEMYLL